VRFSFLAWSTVFTVAAAAIMIGSSGVAAAREINGCKIVEGELSPERHTVCKGHNFDHANMTNIDLRYAELQGASFHLTRLNHAQLQEAKLDGATITGTGLIDANLMRASLVNANLLGAVLDGAALTHANLAGTNMLMSSLKDAEFTDTVLMPPPYYTKRLIQKPSKMIIAIGVSLQ
jgi:uncharacterized protein YjbI with pentapeptide repeats